MGPTRLPRWILKSYFERPKWSKNRDRRQSSQLKEVMGILEERVIRRCLDENGGNRTRTAETLGISRQALQTKLAKWKMRDDLA